jgi:hypothetical protein
MTYELIIPQQNTIKYHVEQLAFGIIYNLAVIPAVCHPLVCPVRR